ncbi:MAG: tetratricopeptide repeat protein, partial [Candidatus Omnitrophica bacterium]|nr:tetratricopeptide repeat protein [Candidatus Omnitrophota bacterium]
MRRSKTLMIVFSIIAFASPALAGYFDGVSPRRKSGAGTTTIKSEKAFLEGDYEEVVRISNSYAAGGSRINDELEYMAGRALLKLGRLDEARNRFTKVVNRSNRDELLDESYLGLADSYYLEGDHGKAAEHYEKVLR